MIIPNAPSRCFHRHSRRGAIVLMTAFFFSVILGALAFNVIRMARFQSLDRGRYEIHKNEFAAAEEALNQMFGHVQFLVRHDVPNLSSQILATPDPLVEGFDILDADVSLVSDATEEVTEGQWQGLSLKRLVFEAYVQVRDPVNLDRYSHPGVRISQRFVMTYIPIFNFAIFYDPIMEIAPGPVMNINGRVHVNSDAYIQSGSGLTFQEHVTVAGNIYHGRHPASGQSNSNGAVNFTTNGSGSYLPMAMSGDQNGDGWLDARDSNWTTKAYERWNGFVKDQAQGVVPLGLPIPPVATPRTIIERASSPGDAGYSEAIERAKLENKADVVIKRVSSGNEIGTDIIGIRQNTDGTTTMLNLNYYVDEGQAHPWPPASEPENYVKKSIVDTGSFYDQREGKTVNTLNLNIANMHEYDACNPDNGILYMSNENVGSHLGVVRLQNGSELPVAFGTTGFTVASDDPVYIQGNYNTTNKTLAMVAGDAINILSNAWNDVNSATSSQNLSSRVASATTVNSVLINGIVPSASNNYSGGVENYFRFLEKWSGKNFTFSGSIIELYESAKATGTWHYGGKVYEAPNRPWSWDTSLGGEDGPPGAPRVVEIVRANWNIEESEDLD